MADSGDDVSEDDVLADRVEGIADSLGHGYNDYAVNVLRKAARRLRGGEGEREDEGEAVELLTGAARLAAREFPNNYSAERIEEAVRELDGGATAYTDGRVGKTARAVGRVVEGLRILTDPEGNLSCIPEGPERYELEAALRDLEGAPLTDDLEHRLRTGREGETDDVTPDPDVEVREPTDVGAGGRRCICVEPSDDLPGDTGTVMECPVHGEVRNRERGPGTRYVLREERWWPEECPYCERPWGEHEPPAGRRTVKCPPEERPSEEASETTARDAKVIRSLALCIERDACPDEPVATQVERIKRHAEAILRRADSPSEQERGPGVWTRQQCVNTDCAKGRGRWKRRASILRGGATCKSCGRMLSMELRAERPTEERDETPTEGGGG